MLSLYIHIPFCVSKCGYCGFYSTPFSEKGADSFIDCLEREAASYRNAFNNRNFSNIFIGGGTPTVLSPAQLERVMKIISSAFSFADIVEFTVEANPNTVTKEKLLLMLKRGANRLSLGGQSFSEDVLRILGRAHTSNQIFEAFRTARDAGFENIGIDLMYGIPGQTDAHWRDTLDAAAALKPEHVSAYNLSLDSGSQWQRAATDGRFNLPDEDVSVSMYEQAVETLGSAGYVHYEISNFSLPGFECRHNLNYWERGEYLGLGPAAWSFVSGTRSANIADTADYTRRLSTGRTAVDVQETVDAEQAANELILLSLRTMKGLDLRRFERDFGAVFSVRLANNAVPLREQGLVHISGGHLRLTGRGIILSDTAMARLSL